MCVPSVSVHTYVSFPLIMKEDDCAKTTTNMHMQEGVYTTKIYSRKKREDSMRSIHHASMLYMEIWCVIEMMSMKNPYPNSTVVETFPDTIHFIPNLPA